MPMGGLPLVPSTATKTLACVNSTEFSGMLYNPYMPCPVSFGGAIELMSIMEAFFDQISFPQACNEDRIFVEPKNNSTGIYKKEVRKYMADDILLGEKGEKATFLIHVQFRRSSTWQGTIVWTEEKKKRSFSSALEMLRLMDQVLTPESEMQKWLD